MLPDRPEFDSSRRAWLALTLGTMTLGTGPRRAFGADGAEDARISKLEERAKKAGIAPFRVSRTENFLGVGDASDGYRREALGVCEALGKVFVKHLRDRGFRVDLPADRMMVVVLKDSESYGALVGQAPGDELGGHYDLDSNRLVVFDFRPGQSPGSGAERINTFTLVHETTHLLAYNTGLLALDRDPGKCVAEGVATYFEMWRKTVSVPAGRVNRPRLDAIRDATRAGDAWIELSRLLTEDSLFDAPDTAQLAYGQSWLLMYHLLTASRSLWPEVVGWFDDMRTQTGDRLAILEKRLGPVDKLDEKLRRLARELSRS
ncbi:DUF1570 domain-containing protein [Paludisphaera sp.]|uniref:DUF1570 domain-containing protein n=1 Tax=Paludisphaera sp. TaxID=2017432 RepID=UPI00301BB602